MTLLNWDNKYTISNIQLDNHHKRLFSVFNRLYDISMDDVRASSFETVLDELISYSNYHFKAEEQYMHEIGYNDIERHASLHKYFTSRLNDIKEREKRDNTELCRELIYFLGNWLKHHVLEEDKRIALSVKYIPKHV
jgi:hemerythrin